MTLLSTTFLIDLMRRDPPALDLWRRLERSSQAIRVPAVILADLHEAAGRARGPTPDLTRVEALLAGYASVSTTTRHAARAGQIAARHDIPLRDALLYACAIEERDEVVVRDGQRVPDEDGLRLVTY